jgi:ribonuclease J
LGYLNIPAGMLVNLEEINKLPPRKVVIMATGAQGEPMAVLGRLAFGRHSSLSIQEGDTVVLSSHTIPGNEEVIHGVINRLFQAGADVYYDPVAPVHVSGHASQEEQKLLINILKPRFFVPIHGELRHLQQHSKTARQVGTPPENIAVVENGYMLTFGEAGLEVGDRVPGGYVFVDGAQVGEIGPAVMRERESLGQSGFVSAILSYSRSNGQLVGQPRIITRGFVFTPEADDLLARAQDVVRSAVSEASGAKPGELEEKVELALSRFLYRETRRRPVVVVAAVTV